MVFWYLPLMKSPSFENCQVWLSAKGKIIRCSDSFSSWVGKNSNELSSLSFRNLMLSLNSGWQNYLTINFFKEDFECFLPLGEDEQQSSLGVYLSCLASKEQTVVSMSPALAPHDSLKKAFMGDLMKDPRALASTLIRLQKAESRLSDYISNFPGIFFTQRADLTFSYLSRGCLLYTSDAADE